MESRYSLATRMLAAWDADRMRSTAEWQLRIIHRLSDRAVLDRPYGSGYVMNVHTGCERSTWFGTRAPLLVGRVYRDLIRRGNR
jgi:hypothetical protein